MQPTDDFSDSRLKILWGADAIGLVIGASPRKTFYLLENGLLPAMKVGGRWCSSENVLRDHFAKGFSGETVTPASDLITVHEACDRSDEKPATIIRWCVRHKIGQHVKTGGGGSWFVYPDRLERLLAERGAAA